MNPANTALGHGHSRGVTTSGLCQPHDPQAQVLREYLSRVATGRAGGPASEGEPAEKLAPDLIDAYRHKVRKRYQAAVFRAYWMDLDGHLKRSPEPEHRDVLSFIGLHRSNVNKAEKSGETDPYNFFVSLLATETELRRSVRHARGESVPFPSTAEILCEAARWLIEFTDGEVVGEPGSHTLTPAEFACLILLARREDDVADLLDPVQSAESREASGRLVKAVKSALSNCFPDFRVTPEGLAQVWKRWGESYTLFHRGIPSKWRFLREAV